MSLLPISLSSDGASPSSDRSGALVESSFEYGEKTAQKAHDCFFKARYDEAIALCEQSLKSPAAKERAFKTKVSFCMAASLYERRDYFRATQIYRRIVAENPENGQIRAFVEDVEKKRSHLLHEFKAKIDPTDPHHRLISNIFAVKKKIYVDAEKLQKNIPFYAQDLAVYRHAMDAGTLPWGISVHPIEGLGEGVLLEASAKPIPPHRFIGYYAGKFRLASNSTGNSSTYVWGLKTKGFKLTRREEEAFVMETGGELQGIPFQLDIDASEMGNFTRFINHSESHPNCEGFLLEGEDKTLQIAIYTLKQVEPGDQFLMNYSSDYWKQRGIVPIPLTPKTFRLDQSGHIVREMETD